ncbi:DnaJ-like protein [Chitinophaga dinghuensis]|uniref:DnaJ-like protein n=1 Tax=Chitinophaga dinghuensis TaxID=1539050 RepID=A0A327VNB5_9BACT|nr:J domain-containing protein [Chitinophaga dinghuensis]RAJ76583.1 DnaJ-like protein [Chitinophaga dinghuensis]
MINYYSILELSNFASGEDVKKAHRLLSKRYHPDLNPGNPVAEEKFKLIQHAYEQLNNGYKKSYYDDILRMNLYSPPSGQSQSNHTQTNTNSSYYRTQSRQSYHQPPPSYTTNYYQQEGQYEEDTVPMTPEERKRELLLKLAICGLFALIIALGAIFGKEEKSNRVAREKIHDNERFYFNSTDTALIVTPGDPASQVIWIYGKPERVQYESGGIEVWAYDDKLIMLKDHKVIWCVRTADLPKK